MCGIAGIIDLTTSSAIDIDLLEKMNNTMFHRGPDEAGTHIEDGIGLAHRRLSIIDISTGQQPIFNDDKSICMVFNGEIYNFQAIRRELETRGYHFKTSSDSEVIIRAWEEWQQDCVLHLRGMFGFAIWDRNRQQAFIARDRLGVKPLFYSLLPSGRMIFASELKGLRVYPGLNLEISHQAIEEYFSLGYVPEPDTIFKSVSKLQPGHFILMNKGDTTVKQQQYWDVTFKEDTAIRSEEDYLEEFSHRFKEAVDIRLMSEVPLGAFLSGGVDSSAVVAAMASGSSDAVNTCSISFDSKAYDESEYADMVAQRYNTNHTVETVKSDDFSLIDKLIDLYDEPYADSSALPTYRVCELAKKQVTVVLSGDGGDESLAGYRRYKFQLMESKLRHMAPDFIRQPIFGLAASIYPKADWAPKVFRAKSTFEALSRNNVEGYFNSVSIVRDKHRSELFSDKMKTYLDGYNAVEVFKRHARNSGDLDPLSQTQYIDLKTYLVGDILTKVDRASMAHSLEVRSPFLDHELVDWMATLPVSMKLKGGEGKYILKKAMEPLLPHDVLYRKKMGFSVPLAEWFRGELKDKIRTDILSEQMLDSGFFKQKTLQNMLDHHQSGVRDYSAPIWTTLMFSGFLKSVS